MQQFSYKSESSASLRYLKEPKRKKKKWNIDRVLFLIILAIVFLLILRYFYIKLILVEGYGQIAYDKLDVNFTEDIRINRLYISENEYVENGDTLFHYSYSLPETSSSNSILAYQNNRERWARDLENIELELAQLQIELSQVIRQKKLLEIKYKREKELVLLYVYTKKELIETELAIQNNELDEQSLRARIQLLAKRVTELRNKLSASPDKLKSLNGLTNKVSEFYITYKPGIVGRVLYRANEVCYRPSSVLTIHSPDSIHITGYFDLSALKYISKGRVVDILFPDGTKSFGYIKNSFVATYELPSEFQKKYEPTTRSIVVTLLPLNTVEGEIWRRYYKLNVRLKINKWWSSYIEL